MENLFDLALAARRRQRAAVEAAPDADFLLRRNAEDLADRLGAVERRFGQAAAIMGAAEHARAALLGSGKAGEVMLVATNTTEALELEPASLDLAVSLNALDTANDVPGLLVQMRRALRPDGLLLAAFAGNGTLAELRECLLQAETELSGGASPRIHPFADVREAGALLQRAGFALPVADIEQAVVRYDDMFALMRDLRAMGATNVLAQRSRRPASRALFLRAAEIYAERFADPDGRIRATFTTIWLSGWVPHASQQQPARRGSATASLADALKSED
ncbi:MAG TPA: methyltransferase domain-containing protein [Rhizobiaceae bacterium]|nr:methyltransferase domain-containing protein [Rhizobiaceae bacterium]